LCFPAFIAALRSDYFGFEANNEKQFSFLTLLIVRSFFFVTSTKKKNEHAIKPLFRETKEKLLSIRVKTQYSEALNVES